MSKKIKFTACEHLDFADNYTAKKELIDDFGIKACWDTDVFDVSLHQLVQFCKKRGRLNNSECCLREVNKMCSDYEDFEHTVII